MAQKKRLTRKEKIKYTRKGICWKCKIKLEKNEKLLICKNCGVSIETS